MSRINQIEIEPDIYISGVQPVNRLPDSHPYDEVVSLGYIDYLGREKPKASTTGDAFRFPDGPHDYRIFKSAVDYVIEALEEDQKTLVHCQAGVSRSASVCSAAIATRQGVSPQEALDAIEDVRPKVNPREMLWESVLRYIDE